ncbi:MAG TPA: long-chain fatty acid--CoA ligase [Myxococcales bacterium]|jgi:long-chain acyl-CoA synthetase
MVPQSAEQQGPAYTIRSLHTAQNMLDLLLMWTAKQPERAAVKSKVRGQWKDGSWAEVTERVRRLSLGLTALGVEAGDRVAIFSQTRLEWTLSQLSIWACGAIVVPIYASNTAAEAEYILKDSGCKALFLDHDDGEGRLPGRLQRLKSVRAKLPDLQHVVAFELATRPDDGVLGFAELESRGASLLPAQPKALEARAAALQWDDTAFVMYTSGTTGAPKGVMLTQGNWTSHARAVFDINLVEHDDLVLLFLPLAHSFAQVVTSAWLGTGLTVAFAESVERAVDNAAEIGATVMTVVPRVFEKAYNKVVSEGGASSGLKGRLFTWAMGLFEEYANARSAGREFDSLQWPVAKRLVFSKLQQRLDARFGGKLHKFISGGAPLSRKLGYFFELCGFLVLEGYGLTETSAPTHVNRPTRNRLGSVGEPFPGVQVKIADDGEVLVKGPPIMKGYWKLPKDTEAVFEDGWFKTGDIGEVDSDGYLRITDRKKDLIKTSGGKYVAPQELENALKCEPLVSQVLVHGDRRKFVSALITLNEETVRKFVAEKKLNAKDFAEMTRLPEVKARVQGAVDALNAVQPSYASIKRFAILDHDWAQETGEMTPSLKVKRKFVSDKYKRILDGFYEGEKFD